jgi:hypothetical protein
MQDAYATPFDTPVDVDEATPCVEARLDRLEATIDRLDVTYHGLDRFGRTMRRCMQVLVVLNLASTSLIVYVAMQMGSGHRW